MQTKLGLEMSKHRKWQEREKDNKEIKKLKDFTIKKWLVILHV